MMAIHDEAVSKHSGTQGGHASIALDPNTGGRGAGSTLLEYTGTTAGTLSTAICDRHKGLLTYVPIIYYF